MTTHPVGDDGIAPIELTERGIITHIYIRSYTAGKLPTHIAEKMSQVLQERLGAELSSLQPNAPAAQFTVENVHETRCVGSGAGTIAVVTTSTGCLLAASQVLERGQKDRACAHAVA